jgi:hypothetical protein
MVVGILLFLLGVSAAAGGEGRDRPATPAEQYQALAKEFQEAVNAFYLKATADEERVEPQARIVKFSPRLLELAEKNPKDPVALDALVQVVVAELWLMGNTEYPGRGKDNLEARAIAILLRDHVRSDRLGEACRRLSYGFSRECETFLSTVQEKNPRRDVRGLACLRLAQFLNGRVQRLDLLRERPDMARRYEGLFGKDYLADLLRRDRARAVKEAEALFERAAEQYGDVKIPYGDTVGVKAKADLHEIRHLSVGGEVQEIEGPDQDGKRFKLSDYKGKVVLLYFWSQY